MQDIDKENVVGGILITNTVVSDEMNDRGKSNGVQIWQWSFFENKA